MYSLSPDAEADKMERRKALAASAALTLAFLFCVSEVPSWPSNNNSQIPVTILTTAVAGKKESSFQWQMAEQAYDKLEQKMFAKIQKEENDLKQAPVRLRPVHPKPAVIVNMSTPIRLQSQCPPKKWKGPGLSSRVCCGLRN